MEPLTNLEKDVISYLKYNGEEAATFYLSDRLLDIKINEDLQKTGVLNKRNDYPDEIIEAARMMINIKDKAYQLAHNTNNFIYSR